MREIIGMAMLAVIVAAFVGIVYAWGESYDGVRNAELQKTRDRKPGKTRDSHLISPFF